MACKKGRGKGGGCRRSNALYEIECSQCPEETKSVYIGEKKKSESFMLKHQIGEHGGAVADFSAKILGTFKDCLSRQVSEGIHIRRCSSKVLNSKAEWHQPAMWRVRSELCQE